MSDNPFQTPQSNDVGGSHDGSGSTSVATKPPVSITVFGVLNLVFGALGICGSIFTVIGIVVEKMALPNQPPNPLAEVMNQHPLYGGFQIVGLGLGFLVTILLIVAGICLLKRRRLGRTLSNFYGIYGIVMPLISIFMFAVFFRQDLMPITQDGFPLGAITFWAAIGGGLIGMIYPVLLLIFLNRDKVKQALH